MRTESADNEIRLCHKGHRYHVSLIQQPDGCWNWSYVLYNLLVESSGTPVLGKDIALGQAMADAIARIDPRAS
jgi:hypothetical protein